MLVSKLGWDLAPITAFDFVDHLLCRVPFLGCDPAVTRKHATTFLALAVIGEYTLNILKAVCVCVLSNEKHVHR